MKMAYQERLQLRQLPARTHEVRYASRAQIDDDGGSAHAPKSVRCRGTPLRIQWTAGPEYLNC